MYSANTVDYHYVHVFGNRRLSEVIRKANFSRVQRVPFQILVVIINTVRFNNETGLIFRPEFIPVLYMIPTIHGDCLLQEH